MIYILASIVWLVFLITHIGPNLNGCKLCEAEEPNYVGPMLLPRQHQINRAGVRVRGVSDQYFTIITMLNSLLQQTLRTRLLDPMRIRVRIGPQYLLFVRIWISTLDETGKIEAPCHSRNGTIKIPPCSMPKLSRKGQRLHYRQWCLLYVSEIFSI